jgi:hypothetical protein
MFALPVLAIGFIFSQSEDVTFYLNKTFPPSIPDGCFNNFNISCGDIDYVMSKIVNISDRNTTVYIDSGIYDCSYYYYTLFSLSFSLIGDVSSSSSTVNADDISTYPVLVSNISNPYYDVFHFVSIKGNFSFEQIKFLIGNKTINFFSFIYSFILFYFNLCYR